MYYAERINLFLSGTAFGFCEFEDPEATLRCMRLLNDWLISDKKLVVRCTHALAAVQIKFRLRTVFLSQFLSASLYFSKRGAY